MSELLFEWDSDKAQRNVRTHRVSFDEALTVFTRAAYRVEYNAAHSDREDRWKAVGLSDALRLLAVTYTRRGDAIRIITARKASSRERRQYAETESQS